MEQLVIRYSGGLVKNQKQAQYILLVFVVLIIIISFLILFGGKSKPTVILSPVGDNPTIYEN